MATLNDLRRCTSSFLRKRKRQEVENDEDRIPEPPTPKAGHHHVPEKLNQLLQLRVERQVDRFLQAKVIPPKEHEFYCLLPCCRRLLVKYPPPEHRKHQKIVWFVKPGDIRLVDLVGYHPPDLICSANCMRRYQNIVRWADLMIIRGSTPAEES